MFFEKNRTSDDIQKKMIIALNQWLKSNLKSSYAGYQEHLEKRTKELEKEKSDSLETMVKSQTSKSMHKYVEMYPSFQNFLQHECLRQRPTFSEGVN